MAIIRGQVTQKERVSAATNFLDFWKLHVHVENY